MEFADRFHWTPEQIRALTAKQVRDYRAYLNAKAEFSRKKKDDE